MRENLLLLEFEFADEAKRVYNSGVRRFRGRSFCLEKWKPSVGCFEGDRGGARLVWVRILSLPLHLWGRSLFRKFGDSCGRFVAVDENTVERQNLKWARILVETRGWKLPSLLQVVASPFCFVVQLWWEDEVAPSRTKGSVGSQPSPLVSLQPEKLPPSVLGSRAPASDMTGAATPPSHACDVDTGERMDAMAHSGLACANSFGPGLGKA